MSKTEFTFKPITTPLQRSLSAILPKLTNCQYDEGEALYYSGRNQEALEFFNKILQSNSDDLTAYTYKINILLRMHQYVEVIYTCNDALNINSNLPAILYNKVCALASLDLKEKAKDCYYKASTIDSYGPIVSFYKGKALFYLDRKNEAIAILGKAVEQDQNYAEAHLQLGNAFYASNNLDEASISFSKVLEINSNYSYAYYGLGKVLYAQNKYRDALQAFQKVIDLNPDSPHAYNYSGVVTEALGNQNEAAIYFTIATHQNPKHPLYFCNRGKILNDMGRGEEALFCFNKAYSLSNVNQLEGRLSPDNIEYVDKVFAVDRVTLIEQLKDLQSVTVETQKVIENIEQGSASSMNIVKTFEALRRSASEATSEAVNGLSKAPTMIPKQRSTDELKAMLDQQHKEMESLLQQISQLKHQQSAYGHKLSEYEVRIDEQDNILQTSRLKDRAEIEEEFEYLRNLNSELYAYCKTFYWTTINLFGAYRSLSTGLIQGNFLEDSFSKESLLVASAKKLTSGGSVIAKGIPFLGGVLGVMDSLIDFLYKTVKQNQFNNKISSINKVIQSKFNTEEDISLGAAKIALSITYAKEYEILNPNFSSGNSFDTRVNRIFTWLKDQLESVKQGILPSIEMYDKNSAGVTLALTDVAMMFVYICKHSNSIIEDFRPIEKHLELIIEYGELNVLMIQIGDTIFTDAEDSTDSTTPPSSPEEEHANVPDTTHNSMKLTGEGNHCCCIS